MLIVRSSSSENILVSRMWSQSEDGWRTLVMTKESRFLKGFPRSSRLAGDLMTCACTAISANQGSTVMTVIFVMTRTLMISFQNSFSLRWLKAGWCLIFSSFNPTRPDALLGRQNSQNKSTQKIKYWLALSFVLKIKLKPSASSWLQNNEHNIN